jgi:hypothetical protein
MSTVAKYEAKIRGCERLSVSMRKSGRDVRSDAQINAVYRYRRAAPDGWTVEELKEKRLRPAAPGYDFEVLDSSGEIIHGKTLLKNARTSRHA